jgi:alkyldihydroxyacetonephosphate synthase
VGSEGTLAVVTAATFRLHPSPASRAFGGFTFGTTEEGWEAMRAMFQAGLRPAVSRLYDPFDAMLARQGGVKSGKQKSGPGPSRGPGMGGVALRAILRSPARVNELLHSSFGAKRMGGAMLVLIFEGAGDAPREQLEQARRIAEGAGGRWDGEAAARRWLEHRYAVSYRQAPIFAEGAFVDTMEVAARWSQLGALYDGVRRALGRHVFVMAHLSHAYPDGCCIYFSFVGRADPGLVRERGWDGACEATYDRTWQGALAAAVDAGGTLSHHHGVGRSKAPRLPAELGAGVGVVRSLMRALDPKGLLNPGNLVPVEGTPVVGAPVAPTIDRGVTVDEASLLASVPAAVTLADADSTLRARGLTLDLHGADMALPLGRWLAEGARGARDPWLDPTDQLLAGFDATLPGGARLAIRPTPRRAVGPDLTALFLGTRDRFGPVDRAWMRVHRVGVPRPTSSSFTWDRDPPVTPGETSLLDAIATSLTPEATPSDGRR